MKNIKSLSISKFIDLSNQLQNVQTLENKLNNSINLPFMEIRLFNGTNKLAVLEIQENNKISILNLLETEFEKLKHEI